MIFPRKRIRKRNRQKKTNRSFFLPAICIIFVLAVNIIIFFQLHRYKLIIPIPKLGAFQVTGNQQEIKKQQEITDALHKKGLTVTETKIASNSAIIFDLETGEQIIFSENKDTAPQIASLQVIMTQLTMVGKRFSKLDLRFDKPVIVLK